MTDHTDLIARLRRLVRQEGIGPVALMLLARDAADALEAQGREIAALRADAQCYHHLVGLISQNRSAFAGEVLDWFTGYKP